jgi:hypothetical protein
MDCSTDACVLGVIFHTFYSMSGGARSCSSKSPGAEDLEMQAPILRGDCATFHFSPTLPGMLRSTLRGDQVIEVRQPCQKRLLACLGESCRRLHNDAPLLQGLARRADLDERAPAGQAAAAWGAEARPPRRQDRRCVASDQVSKAFAHGSRATHGGPRIRGGMRGMPVLS